MATQPYLIEGKRVPGVTTVIGSNLAWNKDALMAWANREGLEGRNTRDRFSTANTAASIGTLAHEMIEADIHHKDPEELVVAVLAGQEGFTPEMASAARKAYKGYLRWKAGSNLKVIATEAAFVDEEYRTGGTIDALIEMTDPVPDTPEEELVLQMGDWKSSKGTYSDHFIQVAAYTHLVERRMKDEGDAFFDGGFPDPERIEFWRERLRAGARIEGAHVLRVGKDTGAFAHHFWTREQLDEGWKVFQWLRSIHHYKWIFEGYCK